MIIVEIILERVKEYLENVIDKDQAGFRSRSSYIDHINILRIILEQSVEFRSSFHLLFINLEKTFDSLNREYIWCALHRRGILKKPVAALSGRLKGIQWMMTAFLKWLWVWKVRQVGLDLRNHHQQSRDSQTDRSSHSLCLR